MLLWLAACDSEMREAVALVGQPSIPAQVVGDDDPDAIAVEGSDGGRTVPYACPVPIGTPVEGGWDAALPALVDSPLQGLADPPRSVHVGFGADASEELWFVWETLTGTVGSRVEIGPTGGDSVVVQGASYEVTGARLHLVRVCGLEAGREWTWRVGMEGSWSEPGSVLTAPEAGGDSTIRFAVMGDSRGSPETFGQIMDAATAAGAEFALFSGDAVSTGSTLSYWQEWFAAAPEALRTLPILFVHGNHEGNDLLFYGNFPTPTDRGNFGVDYGPVHFSVANDTLNADESFEDLAAWLAADLASSSAPWRIPTFHRPAVSSCKPHGEDPDTREFLLPVVEASGARIVINGHNHNYERSHPVKAGVVDDAGVVHIVSGGAGAPLYTDSYGYDYTAVEVKTQHWVLIEADAQTLSGTAYDLAGNVIDEFSLAR